MRVNITTECAHCRQSMEIEIDSELGVKANDPDCEPIVFVPDVNLFALEDDSIIDAF